MYRYGYRRPTMLRYPNQLQAFLQGLTGGLFNLGQGIVGEKERKRTIVGKILDAVTNQNYDPRIFATPEGEAMLKNLRVEKEEPILRILETAKTIAGRTQPEVGPPAPFTLERFKDIREQEAYTKSMDELMARERMKEVIKKEFEETPEMTAFKTRRYIDALHKFDIPVQDINIKGVNILTDYEMKKDAEEKTKDQDELQKIADDAYLEASNEKTNFTKYLMNLNEDPKLPIETMAESFLSFLTPSVISRAKMVPRERAFQVLTDEFNRNLIERNKDIRRKEIRARTAPDEIRQIEPIPKDFLGEPSAEELEPKEPKPTDSSVVRDKIIPPKPKEEPKKRTEGEYQEYATVLKALGWSTQKLKSDAGKKLLNASAENGFDDIMLILKYLR